jgi:hypothetical protein
MSVMFEKEQGHHNGPVKSPEVRQSYQLHLD